MIYFIQNLDNHLIKIGTTTRLSVRLKSLMREHGLSLEVCGVTDGHHKQEQALHKRFAYLRAQGEWFFPATDLVAFIEDECREWDGTDEVRFNTLVRMDDDLVAICKKVAALRGISLAQYFLDVTMPIAKRDLAKEAKKLSKDEGEQ